MNIQPIPDAQDARAAAQYIELMARDLKVLANSAGLGFLAYLLAMVETDAAATVRQAPERTKRD